MTYFSSCSLTLMLAGTRGRGLNFFIFYIDIFVLFVLILLSSYLLDLLDDVFREGEKKLHLDSERVIYKLGKIVQFKGGK